MRRRMAEGAGLEALTLTPKPEYIRSMDTWRDPLYQKILTALPAGSGAADYITSLDVSARKPVARRCCG